MKRTQLGQETNEQVRIWDFLTILNAEQSSWRNSWNGQDRRSHFSVRYDRVGKKVYAELEWLKDVGVDIHILDV